MPNDPDNNTEQDAQETEVQSEAEEETAEPETEEVPTPEQPKKPSRAKDAVTVVVLAAVVLGGTFFSPEITAFVKLQPWSKAGPRGAVQRFVEAVQANDADAATSVLPENFKVRMKNGKIVALAQNVPGMSPPPTPVDQVTPKGSVAEAGVRYVYHETKWGAFIKVPSASGGIVQFKLQPVGDAWGIINIEALGPPADQD